MNSPGIYLEISPDSLKVLSGDTGLELPLERSPNGQLTNPCREKIIAALQGFVQHESWQARQRAYCAIGARGVSLRRLSFPTTGKEDFQKLLLMQIESEFPLAPDELAWGYRSLGEIRQNGSTKQELLVIAVKKEILEDYSTLLAECGLTPTFTLAALARSGLCPQPLGTCAVLEFGGPASELILFENGIPLQVRNLSLAASASPGNGFGGLAKSLNGNWSGRKLFVAGTEDAVTTVSRCLVEHAGDRVECEPLKIMPGTGRSAATLGLKRALETGAPLLFFQSQSANGKAARTAAAPMKWAVTAGALLLGLILLPYAEAIVLKPWLAKKVASIKASEGRLTTIDRELSFLQFLKQNQPPYLDALYLFSKSAPSGAKIESLTMNRRGDVSLRGTLRNADQVAEFRTKLIDSKFFASVTVEEQTPTPDRQKVNVRMTAQWKPFNVLQSLAIGPTAAEIEAAKNKKDSPPGGMPPGMMMPPGAMPVGLPPGVQIHSSAPMPVSVKKEGK